MIRRDPMECLDRMPPADLEAESGLLKAMILDPSQIDCVSRIVTGSDFHVHANGRFFDALVTLYDAGQKVGDMLVLVPALRSLGITESEWPNSAIGNLIIGGGTGSNAPLYAEQIRRLALLRKQSDIGAELLSYVHRPDADPEKLALWVETQLDSTTAQRATEARLIGDVAGDVLAAIDDASQQQRGTMTGLLTVDEAVGGIMPGELLVIAARPGNGKTSLALQIALHNARRDRKLLFVSLEMTERELTQRALCGISKVDSRRVRRSSLTPRERNDMIAAAHELQGLPLRLWAPPAALTTEIRGMARMQAKVQGLSMLVVDYIGLVKPSDSRRQRNEQVAEVTIGLKSLAKELNVPILALCQLNREADKQVPTLGMLRESGNIEQDADMVWFLFHEEKAGPVTLIVAKHRNGDVGDIPLTWIPRETRFEDSRTSEFDDYNRG